MRARAFAHGVDAAAGGGGGGAGVEGLGFKARRLEKRSGLTPPMAQLQLAFSYF
jgi:hypothetical protein